MNAKIYPLGFIEGFRIGSEFGELTEEEASALAPTELDEFDRDCWVRCFLLGTIDGAINDRFLFRQAVRNLWLQDLSETAIEAFVGKVEGFWCKL